jgi:hypothetical protein
MMPQSQGDPVEKKNRQGDYCGFGNPNNARAAKKPKTTMFASMTSLSRFGANQNISFNSNRLKWLAKIAREF